MTARPVRVVLHIGQHKTGSKALQSFLALHARGLRGRGVLYPLPRHVRQGIRAYATSQYRLYVLVRREAMRACGDAAGAERFWQEQRAWARPFESVAELFEALEAERRRGAVGTVVLSAEDLFDMSSAHETGFSAVRVEAAAKILAASIAALRYDPLVVVYLRRQDHLLGAHYVQYIKGSAQHHLDFDRFAAAFAPRLQAREILSPWAAAFGADRIRVRPYEPATLPSGIVADFFAHALELAVPPDWATPAPDVESVNATPDRDHVEFLRQLNLGGARAQRAHPRAAVLEAAFRATASPERGVVGIESWLSPRSRRELLERHAAGNADIAAHFLAQPGAPLFAEPPPEDRGDWQAYGGLSAERAVAIGRSVAATASRWRALRERLRGWTFRQ